MKTTIEIPEILYKKLKIRAVEQRQTLKQIVLNALEREMDSPAADFTADKPSWANRKLLPGFAAAQDACVFDPKSGARDITQLISEERDGR